MVGRSGRWLEGQGGGKYRAVEEPCEGMFRCLEGMCGDEVSRGWVEKRGERIGVALMNVPMLGGDGDGEKKEWGGWRWEGRRHGEILFYPC